MLEQAIARVLTDLTSTESSEGCETGELISFKNSLVIHEGNTKQISTMTVTLYLHDKTH